MPRAASAKSRSVKPAREGYAWLSTRPLHVLLFLIPMIVVYEIGSVAFLSDPSSGLMETVGARRIVSGFFESFGAFTFYLPGIALAAVLLVWHWLERDRWQVDLRVLAIMWMEAALWTLPLLLMGLLIAPRAAMAGPSPEELGLGARMMLAVGAGIYEELLFRLILIAAIHFVIADVVGASHRVGYAAGVVLSALAFSAYHDIRPGGQVDWGLASFYFAAGLYFSALFVFRGFGIVVAAHALYDVIVLVVLHRGG